MEERVIYAECGGGVGVCALKSACLLSSVGKNKILKFMFHKIWMIEHHFGMLHNFAVPVFNIE